MRYVDLASKAWKAMPHTLGLRLGFGSFTAPPHVKLISWLLHMNALGHLPRVGISMPPGAGKSEIIDFYDSVHLLEHNPRRRIILASYAGDLAEEQGKKVRNLIETHPDLLQVRLMQDSRAADKWKTTMGGGMWTVGIGGTITGRRASNLKIDDPHKNFAEAMNEKNQIDVWNWWASVARTRMLPRSAAAVVQTRWAEGDLMGRLRAQDMNRKDWLFVALPAIADEVETIDTILGEWAERLRFQGFDLPDWHREAGQALWPELEPGVPWFDEEEYASIRRDVGEIVWAGLYQQRPAPLEGSLFKRNDWVKLPSGLPKGKYIYVRRWDLAATPAAGDFTAGTLMALDVTARKVYIVDVKRDRKGATDIEEWVAEVAADDRAKYGQVLIRVEQEPGSSGKAYGETFMRTVLQGYPAKFISSTGKKEIRALPLSGQVGARNVYLCRTYVPGEGWLVPDWWDPFINEAAVFPNGRNDDMIDTASLGYVDLIDELPRRGKARVESAARRTLSANALGI